ncbi:phosphotransferase family protein [Nonomuraea fuscirosea]|uniref:phosphotransferase family protein n=1 Tax=Nonomuraea fuscirosea TaxID=1291556 RepID=UPI003435D84E
MERLGTEQTGRAAQVVHGDAHPGNLLATPAGPLWNDFEECMSAPVGWDLACLSRTTRLDGGRPCGPTGPLGTEVQTRKTRSWSASVV